MSTAWNFTDKSRHTRGSFLKGGGIMHWFARKKSPGRRGFPQRRRSAAGRRSGRRGVRREIRERRGRKGAKGRFCRRFGALYAYTVSFCRLYSVRRGRRRALFRCAAYRCAPSARECRAGNAGEPGLLNRTESGRRRRRRRALRADGSSENRAGGRTIESCACRFGQRCAYASVGRAKAV